MSLGEFVRSRRERLRLSQDALARRAGVARATLSMLETDQRIPTASVLTLIGRALDVPLYSIHEIAGALPSRGGVISAVLGDKRLSVLEKQSLISRYRCYVELNEQTG